MKTLAFSSYGQFVEAIENSDEMAWLGSSPQSTLRITEIIPAICRGFWHVAILLKEGPTPELVTTRRSVCASWAADTLLKFATLEQLSQLNWRARETNRCDLNPWDKDAAFPRSTGNVYFIQAERGGPIKIGFTAKGVQQRITELQTGNPYKLRALASMVAPMKTEKALHETFAAHRLEGEWFSPAPEILSFVESIKGGAQ